MSRSDQRDSTRATVSRAESSPKRPRRPDCRGHRLWRKTIGGADRRANAEGRESIYLACSVTGGVCVFGLEPRASCPAAIVSAASPLGQLLANYSIQYLSRPSGFLVIECDDYIGGLFNYQDRPKLFGRRNTLYDAKSRAHLAEIIEILPIN